MTQDILRQEVLLAIILRADDIGGIISYPKNYPQAIYLYPTHYWCRWSNDVMVKKCRIWLFIGKGTVLTWLTMLAIYKYAYFKPDKCAYEGVDDLLCRLFL